MIDLNINEHPKYLIKNIDEVENENIFFIIKYIKEYTYKLINSDKIDKFYDQDIRSFVDVNNGHCEAVSSYVIEEIKKIGLDDNKICAETIKINDKNIDLQLHSYISYRKNFKERYYFDAECLWGVNKRIFLPVLYNNWYNLKNHNYKIIYGPPNKNPDLNVNGHYKINL
jgi:hypothetical protein